ncbi:hypothetical protein ANN_13485 [Periplaneta americana]|uniref:Uncharacterized protein n=1 Tax=Periplaneta americana TaxID=6978 RepID=A0ABQ8TJY7_PERAM|nr:hypothetical protein ANN_13485 [Periplaneta americana]
MERLDCSYKRTTPSERRLLVLLVLALLLAVALIIALAVVSYYSASLLQSMDQTVDPCEDFYSYTCGRWSDEHPTPDTAVEYNWFADRTQHMLRRIRDHLQENASDSEPQPVTQARIMFKSCMDTDELDAQGLEPMFRFLRDIGMSVRPVLSDEPDTTPFHWVPIAVEAKRRVFQDLLVGFGVYPQNTNRTVNRLSLGTPNVRSPLPGYRDVDKRIDARRRKARTSKDSEDEEDPYSAAFLQYLAQVIGYIYKWNTNSTDKTDKVKNDAFDLAIKMAAIHIYEMDERLTHIMNEYDESELDPIEMSVQELQEWTDGGHNGSLMLNWTEYFTLMFEGVENVTLDLEGEDKIVVTNANYLRDLAKLLAETPSKTLELTLWWEVVHVLAPLTNRDLRHLKERYIEKVMGGQAPEARSTFCANTVNYLMGMAVSYFFADTTFLNVTKSKVEEMLSDIKWAFSSLVRSVDWMDEDTKLATLEKADSLKHFVGFPEWLLEPGQLEIYYDGMEVNETAYLFNMIGVLHLYTVTMVNSLRQLNLEDNWATDPTDVNAFHTFQANAITVPSGILQFPFYDLGLEALNYGAIGTILGHELTHGFDNSGRQYDKDGNMRQWWSNTTVEEYVNRTTCFIEQYSNYRLEEIDGWVNGKLTLGENIADNGGLRESLRAYRRFKERNGHESRLPGFESFTDEQIFFLSFANVWCENWTPESVRWAVSDEHSPNHIRVLGVLSNSPEFSRIWKCRKGSAMNPKKDKCRIW